MKEKLVALAKERGVKLQVIYHNGRFYYFDGNKYFDAFSLEAAKKSIDQILSVAKVQVEVKNAQAMIDAVTKRVLEEAS